MVSVSGVPVAMVDRLDVDSRDNLRDAAGEGIEVGRVFVGLHLRSFLKRSPYKHRRLGFTCLLLFGHTMLANVGKSALIVLPHDITFLVLDVPCVWA